MSQTSFGFQPLRAVFIIGESLNDSLCMATGSPQILQKRKAHVDSGICITPSSTGSNSYCPRRLGTSEDGPLDTVEQLRRRELELENAMKQPGGARVTQEHELQAVRRKLEALNTAALSDTQTLRVLRCSL